MKRYFLTLCWLIVASLTMVSCLGSDGETTVYNDMAITKFTLGKLNRYLHTTTSEGKDSVYKTSFSASTYKMDIDQVNCRIFCADSLPLGTDVAHVLCTVSTINSGTVFLKSVTSDSLSYFTSGSDSIDFTVPRVFRVYSSDASGFRDYTVSLNARQQKAGVFLWETADATNFPPEEYTAERQSAEAAGMTFLGGTYVESYAMSTDGYIMETEDEGKKWKRDSLDADHTLLPTSALAYVSWPLDYLTDYALVVGLNPADNQSMTLWRKLADYDQEGKWVYMPLAEDNPFYLPRMSYVALAYFNGSVLAFGNDHKIYVSRDQGITWKTSSDYSYPSGFTATTDYKVATDDEDYLWLKDTQSGNTWRGRLTK